MQTGGTFRCNFLCLQVITQYGDGDIDSVLDITERMNAHLTAAVVSNDVLFLGKVTAPFFSWGRKPVTPFNGMGSCVTARTGAGQHGQWNDVRRQPRADDRRPTEPLVRASRRSQVGFTTTAFSLARSNRAEDVWWVAGRLALGHRRPSGWCGPATAKSSQTTGLCLRTPPL